MIKLEDVAREWYEARQEDELYAENALYDLLVSGLSLQQRQALVFLVENDYVLDNSVTSAEVAGELGIAQNHACNILNRLLELRLATREPVIDDGGFYYEWRAPSRSESPPPPSVLRRRAVL